MGSLAIRYVEEGGEEANGVVAAAGSSSGVFVPFLMFGDWMGNVL